MFLKSLFILFLLFSFTYAKEVRIALTFDDFPMGSTALYKKKERVEEYVRKLNKLGIPATFYCIGEQLDSEEGKECLNLVTLNHLLANHSYTHSHLSKIPLEVFQKELESTESLMSSYPNYRKWFRFPYFDYGDREQMGGTSQKRLKAIQFLKQRGYINCYATINTFDWHVDAKLKNAVAHHQKVDWQKLKETYLELLEGWMDDAHEKWIGSLKKDFVHVLLFHQNDLNAIYLEDIVEMIKKKNWKIVSGEEAFEHPIRYLSYFSNSKGRLFKKPFTLSLDYIDTLLTERNIFSCN